MKKLVLTDVEKIEIVESPIPVPKAGEAVVRIQYAGICGSDLHVFHGLHPTAKLPLVMGHEACGTVYAINSARTDIKINDKVCFHTVAPCRSCENCCVGRENLCTDVRIMGTNMDGVFTQYMLVDASRLIKLNDHVDMRIGALIEPLTVGIHDVRRSGLSVGGDVFIAGAGPIGLIIAIVARLSGAAHIVMSEPNPVRIEIAQKMGFTAADPTKPDFQDICSTATSGKGFDAAFEVTSLQAGFDTCLHQIKLGGVMIQVGMPPRETILSVDIDRIIYGETELRGVRHHTMSSMQTAAKIVNSGIIDRQLEQLVSAIYPFEQCTEAFRRAGQDKTALRVLMDFS
ncbi:Sorbitol dehydrogenase [uncultured Blautia sp.]|nr:Sorbitol dehydrogenase [uncultured Blautia sp.]